MKKSIIFFAISIPLIVFSRSRNSNRTEDSGATIQVVYSGLKNIVFIPASSDSGKEQQYKTMLAVVDSSKAKLIPAISYSTGYYELVPRKNFQGAITVVTISQKDNRMIGMQRFNCMNRPVLNASFGGRRNCAIKKGDFAKNSMLSVGFSGIGDDSTHATVDTTGRFKIIEFRMILTAKGKDPHMFSVLGGKIRPDVFDIVKNWPEGGSIWFEGITAHDAFANQQIEIRDVFFKLE
ncbi:MAG: hypothetical protein ACKOQ6_00500 [Bacteroidota bacterium]